MRVYQFHHPGISTDFVSEHKKTVFKKKTVPGTGLEPAYLTAYAPQTYVSTNFTTRAGLRGKAAKVKKLSISPNKADADGLQFTLGLIQY